MTSPVFGYPLWETYEALADRELRDLSRAEARAFFDAFLAAKDSRLNLVQQVLAELLGGSPRLDESGIRDIDARIWDHLLETLVDGVLDSERCSSFLHDVGILAGEALIREIDGVDWSLWCKGPKISLGYNTPVIAPFPCELGLYWPVVYETVADGTRLQHLAKHRSGDGFSSRLLFRYRFFSGREQIEVID